MAMAYAEAFPWPLTPVELQERTGIPLGEITSRLEALGGVSEDAWRTRVRQQKECAQKWTRMLRRAWWLQAVPYVRAIFASGSLALGNTDPDSDWDLFVVAQKGRLYTARAGLLFAAWLMRRLRTKRMRAAPDRFCFNHLITTDGLAIRHRSIFVAHALAELVPMHDPRGLLSRLWQANHWIADHRPIPNGTVFVRRSFQRSRVLGALQWSIEFVLNTFVGTLVERALKRWMQKRIAREPATHASGGRVVADDRELEFHPASFEAVILARYNAALGRIGLGQCAQRDSGLTR
jgi:predicted nucleotidyltransferase